MSPCPAHQSPFALCPFPGREERLRKEEEERKRQKLEAAANEARKMEALLKEKEQEVLQLQVGAAGAAGGERPTRGI